jgi:hypothetical protein
VIFSLNLPACLMMIVCVRQCTAQSSDLLERGSGIYLTDSDFLKNKITLFAPDDSNNRLEFVLGDVILTRNGKKYKLSNGSFSGYLKDGVRYRFYRDDKKFFPDNGFYKVVEESSVVIYSRVVTTPKTGKHTWYYYSDKLDSPIKKLSSSSLRKVSPAAYSRSLLLLFVGQILRHVLSREHFQRHVIPASPMAEARGDSPVPGHRVGRQVAIERVTFNRFRQCPAVGIVARHRAPAFPPAPAPKAATRSSAAATAALLVVVGRRIARGSGFHFAAGDANAADGTANGLGDGLIRAAGIPPQISSKELMILLRLLVFSFLYLDQAMKFLLVGFLFHPLKV